MIEAPEPPHHHHKTGLPWFDLIMTLAVIALSIASLLTSLQSERSMHALVEQNSRLVSAQSTPLLMLDSANDENGKSVLSMTLSNVGTGPAQIAWFHISDAEGVPYGGGDLTQRVAETGSDSEVSSQQIAATLMRSGEERMVFKWAKPARGKAAVEAWNNLNTTRFQLHASACYCSIFDECRVTKFGDSHPQPVPSCEAALHDLKR